uniref:MADF domain-containing protein n=1 Tax=Anopheles maculatus TaxID=74869 RepID=A0A182SS34_9DIPT
MLMSAPTQHDFKWTHERCMLLLHEYDLLKDKFKDRKHKKKDLWAEISMKFKKIYAYDLEWDVAYKKFRNLKQTFEQVRAKMQQQAITGQYSNRPKWPYFEKFQQILAVPGDVSYSYTTDPHHQQQQQHHPHHHNEDDHDDHHHHHHHHKHPAHLDPATVGQVLGGEDFSDTLVTVFPMGEELEIPAQPVEECSVEHDDVKVDQKEIVLQTVVEGVEEEEEEERE